MTPFLVNHMKKDRITTNDFWSQCENSFIDSSIRNGNFTLAVWTKSCPRLFYQTPKPKNQQETTKTKKIQQRNQVKVASITSRLLPGSNDERRV
jgi:hypothetical protein